MSYYVIIRGPLGVGKSTVTKRLVEILNGECVSIDKILEKNGLDKVSADAESIPALNFIIADDIVLPDVKAKFEQGKKVIFDGCFYHREHIEHLVASLPYPHYIFTLKAPVEVCIERDSKRTKTHGKDATIAVHTLVSRFDYGTVIETTNLTEQETTEKILWFLPS